MAVISPKRLLEEEQQRQVDDDYERRERERIEESIEMISQGGPFCEVLADSLRKKLADMKRQVVH